MKESGRDCYRIEIDLYPYTGFRSPTHQEFLRAGNVLLEQARRHVDDTDRNNSRVTWDTLWMCEKCEQGLEQASHELECSKCGQKICIYCNEDVSGVSRKAICCPCWEASDGIPMVMPNVLEVDWELLRQQKDELTKVMNARRGDVGLLEGLLNFLDGFQDHAAVQLGDEKVYGVCEDCQGSGYTGDYAGPNTAEPCGCGGQPVPQGYTGEDR